MTNNKAKKKKKKCLGTTAGAPNNPFTGVHPQRN